MNRHKHHLLWLMLPAVLVAGYFAIFKPGNDGAAIVTTDEGATHLEQPIQQPGMARLGDEDDAILTTLPAGGEQNEEIERDREFINYAFPLLSKWNLQDVKPLLAEETIAASSDEELTEVMSVLEDRLGELKSFDTPQAVTLEPALPQQERTQDGELQHYQFIAYYEAGEAEVDLVLHKRRNDNSLYSFNIHVPNSQQEIF